MHDIYLVQVKTPGKSKSRGTTATSCPPYLRTSVPAAFRKQCLRSTVDTVECRLLIP